MEPPREDVVHLTEHLWSPHRQGGADGAPGRPPYPPPPGPWARRVRRVRRVRRARPARLFGRCKVGRQQPDLRSAAGSAAGDLRPTMSFALAVRPAFGHTRFGGGGGGSLAGVRVLVGTRKGAYILTADERRQAWDVSEPHFPGWEVYHVAGSPVDPNRLYASQSTAWFGQLIQRSDDGGRTWEPAGNDFTYAGVPGTHQWYDGTPHPWEFARVWHLEPSLSDPDTVYAGVEDAALFRSTDGAASWQEVRGLREHGSGSQWQPGAGGMCLHTIILDPHNSERIFVAISAAGVFRTDDGGTSWRPVNQGLLSDGIPSPAAEVGHCVHNLAMHPSRPETLFMQKHWDVMRSDDGGEHWDEVSGNLPSDFGFPIRVHAHETGDDLCRADRQRLPPCPSGRPAAGVPQPHRRYHLGAADQWLAAGALLRQRVAGCDGRGLAARVRRVLRDHGRAGVRVRKFR